MYNMLFHYKKKLSSDAIIQFNKDITHINLSRIRILVAIALIIETILAILFMLGIFNGDQIILRTIISIAFLSLIILCLSVLINNKSQKIKSIFIAVAVNAAIFFSIFVTNLLFLSNAFDVSLFLTFIFAISITIITEPIWAIARYLGALTVFCIMLFINGFNGIQPTILINTSAFAVIAVVCSIIIYNDALKIFIEKQEVEKAQKILEYMSHTDQLTGLNNRRKIDEILNAEAEKTYDENYHLSIVLLDIDYFKQINDAYGHLIGDEILKDFSDFILSKVLKDDIIGRWGGEEFIIICKDTSLEQAMSKANFLLLSISNHYFPHDISLTVSMGVSCMNKKIEPATLLKNCDQALYRSKENGRNRIEYIA